MFCMFAQYIHNALVDFHDLLTHGLTEFELQRKFLYRLGFAVELKCSQETQHLGDKILKKIIHSSFWELTPRETCFTIKISAIPVRVQQTSEIVMASLVEACDIGFEALRIMGRGALLLQL